MEFTSAFVIAAPPERVWSIFTDVERWPEWTASVTSVTRLDAGPLAAGARVRIRQPRLLTAVWTVTAYEEGRSWTWTAPGLGYRSLGEHVVAPHPSGSEVVLRLAQLGPLGAVVGRITAGLTDRYLALEGEGLKTRAENA